MESHGTRGPVARQNQSPQFAPRPAPAPEVSAGPGRWCSPCPARGVGRPHSGWQWQSSQAQPLTRSPLPPKPQGQRSLLGCGRRVGPFVPSMWLHPKPQSLSARRSLSTAPVHSEGTPGTQNLYSRSGRAGHSPTARRCEQRSPCAHAGHCPRAHQDTAESLDPEYPGEFPPTARSVHLPCQWPRPLNRVPGAGHRRAGEGGLLYLLLPSLQVGRFRSAHPSLSCSTG